MKKYESLMQCHCLKCGHKWYPRKPEKPVVCPNCHRVKWWEEKRVWWEEKKGKEVKP